MTGQSNILVTGATGKVGREVVSQLLDTGAAVRALVREPDSANLPDEVEVVRGDLSEPDTLDARLEGVKSVFLLWLFTAPKASAKIAPAVVDAISRHARRIVYLSADAAEELDSFWAALERLVEQSGLEGTFLRPTGFAANTLMWAEQIRAGGVVRRPYGAAARSLIHERDIATVAIRALTEDRHDGERYVLTGPQTLTQAEQVRIIGEAIDSPVRWEELPREAARQELAEAFGDASFADVALDAWARFVTQPERVISTVEEVTGRSARTFRQWAGSRRRLPLRAHRRPLFSWIGTLHQAGLWALRHRLSMCRASTAATRSSVARSGRTTA